MATPLSGTAVRIEAGGYVADIASVGATLRALSYRGRELVVPFLADEVRPFFRGVTLAPWPNRVVDGRYRFDGAVQQLALTEPERGHALHGLVGWLDFAVVWQDAGHAILEAVVEAQTGYPHRLTVRVTFALDRDGLRVEVGATNTGATDAPYGASFHPYLVAGPGRVDDWVLEFAARTVMTVTADRLVPTGLAEVADGPFDFASPHTIGGLRIDHAFTGLARDDAGIATLRLTSAETGVQLAWDSGSPWLQIHTGDRPEPSLSRIGLAVEPMTCPPDAFNSGVDLVVLGPGDTRSDGWTISALS